MTRVEELALKLVDFNGCDCLTSEMQVKLGDPDDHRDPLIKKFLRENSKICDIIAVNPASDAMLRIVYPDANGHPMTEGIDKLLSRSLSGQALRDRLDFCSAWLSANFVKSNKKILDLGGGSGNYAIKTLKIIGANVPVGFYWDHLDLDEEALKIGKDNASKDLLDTASIRFRKGNFMSDKTIQEERFDFGVLIGVLCSLEKDQAVKLLQRIKIHFKPHAELFAATLTTRSFEEDPKTFRILCNVIGWQLRPKTIAEVTEIFEEAGYEIIQLLSERKNRPGQYAIVHTRIS